LLIFQRQRIIKWVFDSHTSTLSQAIHNNKEMSYYMKKYRVLAAVVLTAFTMSAGVAHADEGSRSANTTATKQQKKNPHLLDVATYNCDFAVTGECVDSEEGFSVWVKFPRNGQDSPLDSNSSGLLVHTPNPALETYDYAEISSYASLNINRPASSMKNLSFEALGSSLRGGSPRIDVFLATPMADGGTYVAIDAGNCQQSISSTWVRADATGRKTAGCTIYSSGGTAYASDGTNTAWQSFLAANPGAVVSYTFMVIDIPTGSDNLGDYRIDRIALGTGKIYKASNSPVTCSNELSC
jgi:hypothetical protein